MEMERVVVITGGGSGMGRCMSGCFAERGWRVCVADISRKSAERSASEIKALGPGAIAVQADIRNARDVKNVIDACSGRWNRIDAWVNNAGVTDKQHRVVLEVPYKVWNEILSVNLFGTFTCVKECAAFMKKQGYGNIVNITSLLGQRGYTRVGDTAYGVSKAAVEALTEYTAGELEGTGININSLYPGAMVNTGFFDYLEENEREKLENPAILNELSYMLCSISPGELTGGSFSFQNWKENPEFKKLSRNLLLGEGN
ncbi:MAG TPA: SDR family oxidoreductase [Spirochaetota bacterium]|nr:SDR family oxidoreductase [Spirochaetota bacterium]